ncbi:MAG: hypothetical protein AAGA18_14815 [Verrucomicrobiota bacterium]
MIEINRKQGIELIYEMGLKARPLEPLSMKPEGNIDLKQWLAKCDTNYIHDHAKANLSNYGVMPGQSSHVVIKHDLRKKDNDIELVQELYGEFPETFTTEIPDVEKNYYFRCSSKVVSKRLTDSCYLVAGNDYVLAPGGRIDLDHDGKAEAYCKIVNDQDIAEIPEGFFDLLKPVEEDSKNLSDKPVEITSKRSRVQKLQEIFGSDVLLLHWPLGVKGSPRKWRHLMLDVMDDPVYLKELESGNIGLATGAKSNGLCCVDIDDDSYLENFLKDNPEFKATTQVVGSKGVKFFYYETGELPKNRKLRHQGKDVGDFLSTGKQAIVFGKHPEGMDYKITCGNPPIEFDSGNLKGFDIKDQKNKDANAELETEKPVEYVPEIELPGENLSISDCAEKLYTEIAKGKRIFYRGGGLCEILETEEGYNLATIDPHAFRSRIESYVRVVKQKKDKKVQAVCPDTTAKALMKSQEAREILPNISSVVNCPILTYNQEEVKILELGYHPECGGVFITKEVEVPEVLFSEAKEAIESLFAEFDFQSEADKSRAIACLLTPALKMSGLIKGSIPLQIIEADHSQAGKGYQQKIVCAVYNDNPRVVTQKKGNSPGSLDESLANALVKGSPFIQLDNIRGRVDSPMLEAFMTASGSFGCRTPYKAEIDVDPRRYNLMLTSNSAHLTKDMANRSNIVRIKKRCGYAYKKYPEGDLVDHVRANCGYFLGCVFSIIIEYIKQGTPRTKNTQHDFREWVQSLDWIVMNLFDLPSITEGHQKIQQDSVNSNDRFLREVAIALKKTGRLGIQVQASDIVGVANVANTEIPGLRENASDEDAARRVGMIMSQVFESTDRPQIDDFSVSRFLGSKQRPEGKGSTQVKLYAFTESNSTYLDIFNPITPTTP